MIYTTEVENMCPVAKGAKHEPAPIPEEGQWVHAKKIEDIRPKHCRNPLQTRKRSMCTEYSV